MGLVEWLAKKQTQPKEKKRRVVRKEPVTSYKFTSEEEKAFKEKLAFQLARADAAMRDRGRKQAQLRETVDKAISGAEARKEKRVASIKTTIAEVSARKAPQSDGEALVNAIQQVKEKTQLQVYGEVERTPLGEGEVQRTQVSEARRIPVSKGLADKLKKVRESESDSGWGSLEDLELPKELAAYEFSPEEAEVLRRKRQQTKH
jgi:hypothetical protein